MTMYYWYMPGYDWKCFRLPQRPGKVFHSSSLPPRADDVDVWLAILYTLPSVFFKYGLDSFTLFSLNSFLSVQFLFHSHPTPAMTTETYIRPRVAAMIWLWSSVDWLTDQTGWLTDWLAVFSVFVVSVVDTDANGFS